AYRRYGLAAVSAGPTLLADGGDLRGGVDRLDTGAFPFQNGLNGGTAILDLDPILHVPAGNGRVWRICDALFPDAGAVSLSGDAADQRAVRLWLARRPAGAVSRTRQRAAPCSPFPSFSCVIELCRSSVS